jgi:hypothetical protein
MANVPASRKPQPKAGDFFATLPKENPDSSQRMVEGINTLLSDFYPSEEVVGTRDVLYVYGKEPCESMSTVVLDRAKVQAILATEGLSAKDVEAKVKEALTDVLDHIRIDSIHEGIWKVGDQLDSVLKDLIDKSVIAHASTTANFGGFSPSQGIPTDLIATLVALHLALGDENVSVIRPGAMRVESSGSDLVVGTYGFAHGIPEGIGEADGFAHEIPGGRAEADLLVSRMIVEGIEAKLPVWNRDLGQATKMPDL